MTTAAAAARNYNYCFDSCSNSSGSSGASSADDIDCLEYQFHVLPAIPEELSLSPSLVNEDANGSCMSSFSRTKSLRKRVRGFSTRSGSDSSCALGAEAKCCKCQHNKGLQLDTAHVVNCHLERYPEELRVPIPWLHVLATANSGAVKPVQQQVRDKQLESFLESLKYHHHTEGLYTSEVDSEQAITMHALSLDTAFSNQNLFNDETDFTLSTRSCSQSLRSPGEKKHSWRKMLPF